MEWISSSKILDCTRILVRYCFGSVLSSEETDKPITKEHERYHTYHDTSVIPEMPVYLGQNEIFMQTMP